MRKILLTVVLLGWGLLFFCGGKASAEVTLPSIISDNMVLQAGKPVAIWGKASPGEAVTVRLLSQEKAATADAEGRWRVTLDALESGGPYEMTVSGQNTIEITNILAGEVWLASGQSNMAMRVQQVNNSEEELAESSYPEIRLFLVPNVTARTPQDDVSGSWVECGPETVNNFSATAYFFGRHLHKNLGTPVGLINSSWSGSLCEAWVSAESLAGLESVQPLLRLWEKADASVVPEEMEAAKKKYEEDMAKWRELREKAASTGEPVGRAPRAPFDPRSHYQHPSGLYNAMISPLLPYGIKGVIWYQGEGNSDRAYQYRSLFQTLITDWRGRFGQGDFPFLFVQLPNYREVSPVPTEEDWAELREAQAMALSLPNTGMAITIDVGEAGDVHPKDKQSVGHRLALAARSVAYGEDIVGSGPLYERMEVEGGTVRLYFKHVGGGLVARDTEELTVFAVAGGDRKFVWADARIDGDTVVVSSSEVPEPVAVRYAWQSNPGVVNFYNQEGLPASPFRTDDWPIKSEGELIWWGLKDYR